MTLRKEGYINEPVDPAPSRPVTMRASHQGRIHFVSVIDGAAIHGVVVQASLDRLPDSEPGAELLRDQKHPGDDFRTSLHAAISDATGICELRDLAPGKYALGFYHPAMAPGFGTSGAGFRRLEVPGPMVTVQLTPIYAAVAKFDDQIIHQGWGFPSSGFAPGVTDRVRERVSKDLQARFPGTIVHVVIPSVETLGTLDRELKGKLTLFGERSGWVEADMTFRRLDEVVVQVLESRSASGTGTGEVILEAEAPLRDHLDSLFVLSTGLIDAPRSARSGLSVPPDKSLRLAPGHYQFHGHDKVLAGAIRPQTFTVKAGTTTHLSLTLAEDLRRLRFVIPNPDRVALTLQTVGSKRIHRYPQVLSGRLFWFRPNERIRARFEARGYRTREIEFGPEVLTPGKEASIEVTMERER